MERLGHGSVLLLYAIVLLIPAILFVVAIQKTLKAISPRNRKFEPPLVWLILIPLVGNIWAFVLAQLLSQSIEQELKERDIPVRKNPLLLIGLIFASIQILAFIPFINHYTRYPWFVCFFIYWYSVVFYKRKLTDSIPVQNTGS